MAITHHTYAPQLQTATPAQHYAASINPTQSLEAAGPSAQPQHPAILSLAGMSRNTLEALEHNNQSHEPLAMRAIELIGDTTLSFQSEQGADAHYATVSGDLTVHARLNEQSRYDVISIGSPTANPLYLTVPLPPANTHRQASSASSHLAAHYSRRQLTQALIRQSSHQDFSGQPLLSGAAVSPPSRGFSQGGSPASASGIPGHSRNRPAHAARIEPSAGPSQSGATPLVLRGASNKRVEDPDNRGKFVTLGALRSRQKEPDPETGEMVSRSTLRDRKKVLDPETGEMVSIAALRERKKVPDPETGEMVSRSMLRDRKKVLDPETGEMVSATALRKRQKARDPETGDMVRRSTLRDRKKVLDPVTGEMVSATALRKRQKKRAQAANA